MNPSKWDQVETWRLKTCGIGHTMASRTRLLRYPNTLSKPEGPNENVILYVFKCRASLCFQVHNVTFHSLGIQKVI